MADMTPIEQAIADIEAALEFYVSVEHAKEQRVDGCPACALRSALTTLRSIPDRATEEWIPTSKERPPDTRPVLAHWCDGDSDAEEVMQFNGVTWANGNRVIRSRAIVDYWMPILPLPGEGNNAHS